MRLLLVTDRYGSGDRSRRGRLAGQWAPRLAARGHGVDVLARWATEADAGLDGVTVHRPEPAAGGLDAEPVAGPDVAGDAVPPLPVQEAWMAGRYRPLGDVSGWLSRRAAGYDVVAFFGYRSAATWAGLPAAAGRVATVLHPLAADEPRLYLPLFDTTLRHPTAHALLDEEEAALLVRRLGRRPPAAVVGAGLMPDQPGDEASFRQSVGVGSRPYLLMIGRPGGEADRLLRYFRAYKARNPGPLALVLPRGTDDGDGGHPDVFAARAVDEETRRGAIDGATAVVRHAGYDGCSLDLAEAWARGRPSLVNGWARCLVDPAYASRAAVIYWGFARFEAAVDLLVADPALASALGAAGRQYAERAHDWDQVLDRYERLLDVVRARR